MLGFNYMILLSDSNHPITSGSPPDFLHKQGILFWHEMKLTSCEKASVLIVDGIIMGFARYNKLPKNVLHFNGTWIHPKYRGLGYGKRLWNTILESDRFQNVNVSVATDDGFNLVKSLEKQWKNLKFCIIDKRSEGIF